MRPKRTRLIRSLACLAVVVCAIPATAQATGIQSDLALMYDQSRFFDRADKVGADWVRVMVPYNRWHNGEADMYVHAVRSAHDSGRKVMVSLMSWYNYPTADEWAEFAREVVPRLAPYVDAWSPMNEPNWPGMAPKTQVRCVPTTAVSSTPSTSTVRNGVRVTRRWVRVRRGRGSHQRHRRHRHWRYTRAHGHQQRHRASWRRVTTRTALYGRRTVYVTTKAEQRQCTAEAFAVAYRRVYDQVAPILAADRGASIVVGDLCPCAENAGTFMDAFYSLGPVDVTPDVLGIHPYDSVQAASDAVAYAAMHDLPVWATEWGLGAPSQPSQWVDTLARFRDVGVRKTFLYDTGGGGDGWDTRIPDDALNLLATAR